MAVAIVAVSGFVVPGLQTARFFDTATALQDGTVLFAGGINTTNAPVASAEIYNPVTDCSTFTQNMTTPRDGHAAALLSNGLVLIAGGATGNGTTVAAELYDPVAGTFAATGNMGTARENLAAVTLPDGEVLIAGGGNCDSGCVYFSSAELTTPRPLHSVLPAAWPTQGRALRRCCCPADWYCWQGD